MDTVEGNKLIAEFVSETEVPYSNSGDFVPSKYCNDNSSEATYFSWSDMKFHTSWDWLMPVIQKIQSLNSTGISIGCDMEHQWKIVVSFIQWYNSTPSGK